MKRKLLRQITNEWRSNIWLCIELMIVSVAIWYMAVNIYLVYRVANLPNGYHTENTYVIYMRSTPERRDIIDSTDSIQRPKTIVSAIEHILHTIEEMPGVEYVAYGANNMPYNYNFSGWNFQPVDADSINIFGHGRFATPEMAYVMGWTPLAGASTPEELSEVLKRGEMIISRSIGRPMLDPDDITGDPLEGAKALIGRRMGSPNWYTYTVGAVVEDMRRGYYEPASHGTFIMPMQRNRLDLTSGNEIMVRVEPGRRNEFVRAFDEALTADRLSTPLYYVAEMEYQDDIAAVHHASQDIENRNYAVIIIFLLTSIFLGLMGTFWFRTSRRTAEIAVRMTAGATRGDIFRRLIGEGLLLVVGASIPAAILDWAIGWYVEDLPGSLGGLFNPWEILSSGFVIAAVLVTVMTVAGIWIPARRAMAIDPARALHDE